MGNILYLTSYNKVEISIKTNKQTKANRDVYNGADGTFGCRETMGGLKAAKQRCHWQRV